MRKFIVFDFDGTIVHSMDLALRLYNELAQKYKTRVFDSGDVDVFKKLSTAERYKFVGAPFYLIPRMIYEFQRNYRRHIDSLPGIEGMKETILDLQNRGFPMGIVSSNSVDNIRHYLQRAKLDVFDQVCSSRGIRGKHAAIRRAAKKWRASAEEIIYIGDEILDIAACKKAGVRMIAVTWGFETAEHLAAHHPDYLVNRPEELLSVFGGLGGMMSNVTANAWARTGLFLEGGGMRGVYTAAVLDFWMDRNLYFPYILGVSSGSWIATSYMARQRGRSRACMIDYARDRRAYGLHNWLLKGSLFGMDFLFDLLPNQLEPFDYDAYYGSDQQLIIVITDAASGEAIYYTNKDTRDKMDLRRLMTASISLPLVSRLVEWKGSCLLDGGIADSLPLHKAFDDGYRKNVLVLNKPKGYRKSRSILDYPAAWVNRKHPPGLAQAILDRYMNYNRALEQIERMEDDGEVFVIRPSQDLHVGRGERRPEKLTRLYELGYADAAACYEAMVQWRDS